MKPETSGDGAVPFGQSSPEGVVAEDIDVEDTRTTSPPREDMGWDNETVVLDGAGGAGPQPSRDRAGASRPADERFWAWRLEPH